MNLKKVVVSQTVCAHRPIGDPKNVGDAVALPPRDGGVADPTCVNTLNSVIYTRAN